MQLEPEDEVHPRRGAIGIRAAVRVSGQRHAAADVGNRGFIVAGEAVQRLEAPHVGVVALEDAQLGRRAQPQVGAEEIADVERGAEDHLAAAQVDAAADPEAEQPQPLPAGPGPHTRRLELLGRRRAGADRDKQNERSELQKTSTHAFTFRAACA